MKICKPVEHLKKRFSTKVCNGWKALTRKSSVIDLWLGSKCASEGFLISVWFLFFHHTLLKELLEVDFKWNPLRWNWLFFKNTLRWSKGLLHKKREKFFVWSFSRCKKILFSKWFSSFMLKIESQLQWRMLFCNNFLKAGKCFWGVVYMRDGAGQKLGADDKTEKKTTFTSL